MPSRGSVLGIAVLAAASALAIWASGHFFPAESCQPPSPQSVESLFAPCQATKPRPPLAASGDPFVTDGGSDRRSP
jgi:hypothetical protein